MNKQKTSQLSPEEARKRTHIAAFGFTRFRRMVQGLKHANETKVVGEGANAIARRKRAIDAGKLVVTGILLMALAVMIGCAKKRPDETAAQFKKREIAVVGAQAMTGLEVWSDLTEVLRNDNRLGAEAARTSYEINETARAATQVARQYLKEGKQADAIAEVERAINALDRAQNADVIRFTDPAKAAQFREGLGVARLALNSLRSILKGIPREPLPKKRAIADAILVIQNGVLHALEQSTYDEAVAWQDGDLINDRLQSKNAARLGR